MSHVAQETSPAYHYDPAINPEDFVDPEDVGDSVEPNPYYPLVMEYKWYENRDEEGALNEIITDEVLKET